MCCNDTLKATDTILIKSAGIQHDATSKVTIVRD